ncbi:MAG: glycosyltransferase family 2 protein [Lachnospiraceae bacterium]|nr:glycosyltransferase family 2 protein [Lachnospiraceae bacterium]
MKDRILLFIPAYNCEKQIARVLSRIDGEALSYISEIIVINNRSTDNTEKVVMDFKKENPSIPLKLMRNKANYGLGGSHKVAFKYAIENGFDHIVVLHGDDQGSLSDFYPVFRREYYKKHECVLGARFMKGSRLEGYSAFRTFGNVIFDFLFAFVVKKKIYDLGSGLNMYSVDMLKSGFYQKFPDNLMFNYLMILAADYYGTDMVFYPVSWREDDQVSNVKMVSQASRVLKMLFAYYADPLTITKDYRDEKIDSYEAEVL